MSDIVVDHVRSLTQDRNLTELATLVRSLPTSVLIGVLDMVPAQEAAIIFRLLSKDESIEVFDSLDSGAQADLLTEFGDTEIADVFGALDPEEQAWLLDEVPAKVAKRLIASSEPQDLGVALTLLGYPAASLGRRMSPQALRLSEDSTVAEALTLVRASSASPEMLTRLPVLAPNRTLRGMVDLADLTRSAPDVTVAELMNEDPWFGFTEDNAEQVARKSLDRGDLLLPVVDREKRLVGLFPIADAARIDREAVDEDHARAGASEPLRRPYLLTPVLQIAKSRIVWLLVLAISATLTVHVLELFEATLAEQVVLALFVPLLIGIGGNTGSQAATTVTRALAVGDVRKRDLWRVIWTEFRAGLLLGVLLGILALGVASLFYGFDIGTVLALTLLVNLPIAATVGGAIPIVARVCRVDPAVFSTPFISTFCDATGLLVYFMVATQVLGI